jgi:hypothetical protein
MPAKIWRNVVKLLTIYIFSTVFQVISPKAAHAFISSLDACAANPKCASALGAELAPAIAAPTTQATTISVTTATGATTTVESVGGVATIVGDMRLSGVAAYYIWTQAQNQQAQDLAQKKYCTANPNDAVCLPPFIGGQDNTAYVISGTVTELVGDNPSFTNAQEVTWYFDRAAPYNWGRYAVFGPLKLNNRIGDTYGGHFWFSISVADAQYPQIYIEATRRNNLGISVNRPWCKIVAINLVAERKDGLQDTNGNPPPLAWKDWSQEKRNAAAKLISPSDWRVIIPYMPKAGELKPGDIIKAIRTIVSGATKDNPTTLKDERLPRSVRGQYKVPSASDSDVWKRVTPAQRKRLNDLMNNQKIPIEERLTEEEINSGTINPKNKCFYLELDRHLGGYEEHDKYATRVTGSPGEYLVLNRNGLDAPYDGLVRAGGAIVMRGLKPPGSVAEVKTEQRWLQKYLLSSSPYYNPAPKSDYEVQQYGRLIWQLNKYSKVAQDCGLLFFMSFKDRQAGLAARELFEYRRPLVTDRPVKVHHIP